VHISLPLLFFLIFQLVAGPLQASKAAIEKALEKTDERDAEKEGQQASELGHELEAGLRVVVDVVVLHGAHEELEDDGVGGGARNNLARRRDLALNRSYLDRSQLRVRSRGGVSGKELIERTDLKG
jgi:hypothetical protein